MTAGLPYVWGATSAEVTAPYPSDRFAAAGSVRMVRAVDTTADRAEMFTWLCQLRRAPYSYDLVDNLGRRSPRTADLAMRDLAVGQSIATVFTVVDFVPDESITFTTRPGLGTRVFGHIVMAYVVREGPHGLRLVGVLEVPTAGRVLPRTRRWLLGWGDLVMMRKQLRVLASLAERDSARP